MESENFLDTLKGKWWMRCLHVDDLIVFGMAPNCFLAPPSLP